MINTFLLLLWNIPTTLSFQSQLWLLMSLCITPSTILDIIRDHRVYITGVYLDGLIQAMQSNQHEYSTYKWNIKVMSNPTSHRHVFCWDLKNSRVLIDIMGILLLLLSPLLLLPHMGSWKDIFKRKKRFSDLKKLWSAVLQMKWGQGNWPVCILVLTLHSLQQKS